MALFSIFITLFAACEKNEFRQLHPHHTFVSLWSRVVDDSREPSALFV